MGNDMSVFEEGELERDFWKAHGPKNESWTEFLSRSFAGMTKILMQPKRMEYSPEDVESRSEDTDFRHEVFTISGDRDGSSEASGSVEEESTSSEGSADLAAALWRQGGNVKGGTPRPLVLYLHTNTRCLVDAKEVLPLCDALGASLLAFDLPGCGNSQGNLTFKMTQDLHRVMLHARHVLGFQEIVLWARGMATAIAVEYCTISSDRLPELDRSCVKFVVLDSPFTSVKQMVLDGSRAIKCFGLAIPETLVRLACRVVRGRVSSRLGSDPFDLKPLGLVERVAATQRSHRNSADESLLPPCQIFSALQDDYIPASHGRDMQRAWEQAGATCEQQDFEGRHFGEREARLLLGALESVRRALVFDKEAEEAAALASLDFSRVFLPSSSNGATFLSAGGKIPWAGVW